MRRSEAANEQNRSILINILVVVILLSLIAGFVHYLTKSTLDIRRLSLDKLADTFSRSLTNIHWQWQSEGRPERINLIIYANQLDEQKKLLVSNTQTVLINKQGWPTVAESADGCVKIWNTLLGLPLEAEGFKLNVDFYVAENLLDKSIDYTCRYGLSKGPYFEYKLNSGQVLSE